MKTDKKMEVEAVHDFRNFQKIGREWNGLLASSEENSVFLTHQWFCTWWKCFSEGKSLQVLLFKDGAGKLVATAPLMKEKNTLRFMASREVTDYCDFIVCKGMARELYGHLMDFLEDRYRHTEKIVLLNIKSRSSTLDFLPRLASKYNFSCSSYASEVAPLLELPSSYEEFLKLLARKNRHELRRKIRRINELDGVKMLRITGQKNLTEAVESFIRLHRKSSSSKQAFWEKKGVACFFRELLFQFSSKGWVEMNSLMYKEDIMASLITFLYQDRILFYNIAYNTEYAQYSPGIYLFDWNIKNAILQGRKTADFLRGREKYKYYLGAKDSKICTLILRRE
ncbi:MAG: GNAT family N-acetyltransferase [Candidatus Aminicenantes bacterium]